MKKEVLSAVNFLVDLLRINTTVLSEEQLLKFRKHAYECLWQHYEDHWFPEKPMKGSGYRCIRINGKMDPLIARAGDMVGLAGAALRALFPTELTMWVDPMEVAYRIGENGSICNLYAPQLPPMNPPPSSGTVKEAKPPEEMPSPIKAAPPKHQPPSSPQFTIQQLKQQQQQQQFQQQQQQQHFSPSKTPSPPQQVQYHSPPRSPIFNTSQRHHPSTHHQQQQLAMFLMNNHTAGNCKDSLRSSALESSARGMERLFVSS